jgi:hypothetical protein
MVKGERTTLSVRQFKTFKSFKPFKAFRKDAAAEILGLTSHAVVE